MPQAPLATVGIIAHSPEVRERAYQLWKATRDYGHASQETGVPDSTLRAWSSRDHWRQRIETEVAMPNLDAETARNVIKVVSSSTLQPPAPLDLDLAESQELYQRTMGDVALRVARHIASLEPDKVLAAADKIAKMDGTNRKALKMETEKANTIVQIALLSAPSDRNQSAISQRAIADLPMAQA